MARIRTIKPEFFTSEDIVELTPLARLFYVSLWCEADREGRLRWKPKTLKFRYLPGDDVEVGDLADELAEAGLIVIYEVDGREYCEIPTFLDHQVINNREKASEIPTRDDACPTRDDASKSRASRAKAEGKGREGKGTGKEGNGKGSPNGDSAPDEIEQEFNALWKIYPKRGGSNPQARALAAYRKQRGKSELMAETIRTGVELYAAWCRATGKIGTEYVLQAATFLGPDRHFLSDWAAPPGQQRARDAPSPYAPDDTSWADNYGADSAIEGEFVNEDLAHDRPYQS